MVHHQFILFWVMFTRSAISLDVITNPSSLSRLSSLAGNHLVIAGPNSLAQLNMTRNSTGHVVRIGGVIYYALEWLSNYYDFTYSMLQKNETPYDTIRGVPGLINYVNGGECDVLVSTVSTPSRISLLDFTCPFTYLPINYLITRADTSSNIASITQPFEYLVWLVLLVSVVYAILALYLINWFLKSKYRNKRAKGMVNKDDDDIVHDNTLKSVTLHVVGVLVSQRRYCASRDILIRAVVAIWVVGALNITAHYVSLLISFLTYPIERPLISSIYDVPFRPDVQLVTNKGLNVDSYLSDAREGFFKQLGDKLRSYPESRCTTPQRCLDMVKSGSHAYIASANIYLANAIKKDFETTKWCNLEMGKRNFLELPVPWALNKHSPYSKDLSNGITRLRQFGLIDHWTAEFQADVRRCLKPEETMEGLKLKNLSGIFMIYSVGILISLLLFFVEKLNPTLKLPKIQLKALYATSTKR